jgi:hypothetical protein
LVFTVPVVAVVHAAAFLREAVAAWRGWRLPEEYVPQLQHHIFVDRARMRFSVDSQFF